MTLLDRFAEGIQALPGWLQTALVFLSVLVLGYFAIKLIERAVDGAMYRSKRIDPTLRNFLDSVTNVLGWVILSVILLSVLGVDLGAVLGGLAIGGFVIGFALKDTLGNLAAGVMLLFYRPYDVGDTVTIGGESGDVIDLGISLTTLKAGDGRIITIPNGNILGGTVVNHTRLHLRRADVMVGVALDADIGVAVQAILEALAADERVLPEPAPSVRMTEIGPHSIGLQVRPWVATGDFWKAKADFHGVVKSALDAAGVKVPVPQAEVRMTGAVA